MGHGILAIVFRLCTKQPICLQWVHFGEPVQFNKIQQSDFKLFFLNYSVRFEVNGLLL